MLVKQRKFKHPTIEKVNRCKILCTCLVDNECISIGAIKPKTISDFGIIKGNLPQLNSAFTPELGYCYTDPNHTGKGYSSAIVNSLITAFGK